VQAGGERGNGFAKLLDWPRLNHSRESPTVWIREGIGGERWGHGGC